MHAVMHLAAFMSRLKPPCGHQLALTHRMLHQKPAAAAPLGEARGAGHRTRAPWALACACRRRAPSPHAWLPLHTQCALRRRGSSRFRRGCVGFGVDKHPPRLRPLRPACAYGGWGPHPGAERRHHHHTAALYGTHTNKTRARPGARLPAPSIVAFPAGPPTSPLWIPTRAQNAAKG